MTMRRTIIALLWLLGVVVFATIGWSLAGYDEHWESASVKRTIAAMGGGISLGLAGAGILFPLGLLILKAVRLWERKEKKE